MTKTKYPDSSEIMYLKADINYTIFHLANGKKLISSYTLKTYEATHSTFIRIHRGTLINPRYIKSLEREGVTAHINLKDGSKMAVSRRRMDEIGKIN